MFGLLILTLIARLSSSQSQVYVSHDRGYRGVSVHLDEGLGQESCQEIIRKIKGMFSAGSRVLHSATEFTEAPVHFEQVTIVVPSLWTERACNTSLGAVTGNTAYKHADILISKDSPGPGGSRVVRGGGCGEPGHQLEMAGAQLLDGRRGAVLGQLLAAGWAQLRYGVFPESGHAGDSLYPNYYYSSAPGGHLVPTGPSNTLVAGSWRHVAGNRSRVCDPTRDTCQYVAEGGNPGVTCSLTARPELETVTSWCAAEAEAGPGMHNVLCGGRAPRAVIAAHPDFAAAASPAPAPPPEVEFSVVRVPQPKYVLVIETSARLARVWHWVRKAVVNLIRYEIPDMSHVAIVTFSSRAATTHGLTLVTRDAGTRLRLADAVPDTANKLSASQAGCVRCGVRTAMEQVLRSREAGGHVIIVTAEDESAGGLDSLATDAITEYINYYNLRVSSVVLGPAAPPPAFSALAALSGGVASSVQLRPSPRAGARDPSVWTLASLGRGLVAAVKVDRAAGARIPETVHLVSGHHNIVNQWTSQGEFVVDRLLGLDTVWGVLVRDDEEHHIKSVSFTDHAGNTYGPFTKMSSTMDDINLKTINFPVGLRPPLDEESHLGSVWQYSVSWYRDPTELDNIVLVRSRPRHAAASLDIAAWTNYEHAAAGGHQEPLALYVQVRVAGRGVAGARVLAALHTPAGDRAELQLRDDGVADPDVTAEDGVYSCYLSPQLVRAGSYQLQLTVTNSEAGTFVTSPRAGSSELCCGSRLATPEQERDYIGAFVRHVSGPTITLAEGERVAAPGPGRVTDLRAEVDEAARQVELSWSWPRGVETVDSVTVSYSHDVDAVIRGLDTRDVVISRDAVARDAASGRVTQRLPAPEVAGPGRVVYYTVRAQDGAGRPAKLSNIVYLNVTALGGGGGLVPRPWSPHAAEPDYTLLGAVLGAITVVTLLTILAVSVWLHRRRGAPGRGKLRPLHGFSNKVSSGVNVVIDKSEHAARDHLATARHVHVPTGNSISSSSATASPAPPSSTSFAANLTPTYWSASQLLADHETRRQHGHQHQHQHQHGPGQHYHQYLPVHHQHHYEPDHDSDILEDNNNEHNTSDQSSSTIVMLNTSLSSSNTGTGGSVRKKNITQV